MYPHERSLVKQYAGRPFVLLGVNSDSDRDGIREVVQEQDLPWRSWWDGGGHSGPIATAWNVRAWPTVYLIDASGRIRHKDPRGEDLDALIAQLVEEAEAQR